MFGTPSLGALGAAAMTDLAFGGGEDASGIYGQGVVGRPVLASEARNDIEYLFDYGHEREYIQKRRARTLQQAPGSAAAGASGAGGIARTVSGRPAPEGPASARGAGAGHGLGEGGAPVDTLRGAGTSHLTQVLGLTGVQLAPTTVRGQLTDASAVLLGVPPTGVRGTGETDAAAGKPAAAAAPAALAGATQASVLRLQAQVAGGSGTGTTTPSVSASTAEGNTPLTGGTATASIKTESSGEEPHLLHPLAAAATAAAAVAAASAREAGGAEGRRPPASPAGSSPPREEEAGAGVFPSAAAATGAPPPAVVGTAPSAIAIGAASVESPRASSEAGGSPVATPSATPAASVDAATALRARIGGVRAEGGAAAGAGGGSHRREPLPKFNLHCLVVDDERVNRKIAGRYLQQLGCTYEAVEDGDEVVPALVMSARPFDAILLDILMSRTNGIEVCRTLREQHVEIPIIAATANYSHKEKAIYQAAGFDRVLQKPFTVKDMAAALAYATNVQLQRGINPGADKGSEASTASGSATSAGLAGDRGSASLRETSNRASEGSEGDRVSGSHVSRQSDGSTFSAGVGSTVFGGVGE
jgi:CheY-like chemotaxis protein